MRLKCVVVLTVFFISSRVHAQHDLEEAVAAPIVFIAAGLAIKNQNELIHRHFKGPNGETRNPPVAMHIADYTQFAPIAVVYGLNLAGSKGKHTYLKSASRLLQSEALMVLMVRSLKYITAETRPDGGYHSFPSGHTAQAFLAATFLHKEFRHKSVWYSVAGYTMASTVGVCRMVSNRHWASDVLVGAGIGVLSANLVYLGNNRRDKAKNRVSLSAVPGGFYFSMKL